MKVQSRKIGVAGGFVNQMMGNNCSEPIVGEGATELHYSDRSPYEVISVSDDKLSCVIRGMSTTYTGTGYGDEQYTYQSNELNHTRDLEWNSKKGQWCSVGYSVEVIKSLSNRLHKEFGWDAMKNLPNGLTWANLYPNPTEDLCYQTMKVIPGVTKRYKNFTKISISFGYMNKYQDPSF